VLAVAIPVMIREGMKPFTTSQTPSDSSQAATGSAASAAREGPCSMPPNNVAITAVMRRAAPMSPSRGMMRATRALADSYRAELVRAACKGPGVRCGRACPRTGAD
jgi:hypothetical protein